MAHRSAHLGKVLLTMAVYLSARIVRFRRWRAFSLVGSSRNQPGIGSRCVVPRHFPFWCLCSRQA